MIGWSAGSVARCVSWIGAGCALAALGASLVVHAASVPSSILSNIELSKPFAARSPWRLVVTQGPEVPDQVIPDNGNVPGEVKVCVKKGAGGPCDPGIVTMPPNIWEAHYLHAAKLVYPRGKAGAPLLLLWTGSSLSANGNQSNFTRLIAYRRASDRFVQIYGHENGHNNNEEVRFVSDGPLRGSVISAEMTYGAPYGYWVVVNKLGADDRYRQVLRYRSATHYGDGNPLAVIDSEMPNIQRRLGLWRPGTPLPLPARKCPKPHLIHTVLWCE